MGIGMAMLEETHLTRQTAHQLTVTWPTTRGGDADVSQARGPFLDYPDLELNAVGARGIGESPGRRGGGQFRPDYTPTVCACANCRQDRGPADFKGASVERVKRCSRSFVASRKIHRVAGAGHSC